MGRPRLNRLASAGKKLKRALELWDKSTGMYSSSSRHVAQWDRWQQNHLPKSVTTIRQDISQGVPLGRIKDYAQCLNVSADLLMDESLVPESETFARKVQAGIREATGHVFLGLQGMDAQEAISRFNGPETLQEVFTVIRGAYNAYWWNEESPDEILRFALCFHECKKTTIFTQCAYKYYNRENILKPYCFLWQNNIHIISIESQFTSLSHAVFINPDKFPPLKQRDPFYLHGTALSEDGTLGVRPMVSYIIIQRVDGSQENTLEKYENIVKSVMFSPVITKEHPDFEALRQAVVIPDMTAGGEVNNINLSGLVV